MERTVLYHAALDVVALASVGRHSDVHHCHSVPMDFHSQHFFHVNCKHSANCWVYICSVRSEHRLHEATAPDYWNVLLNCKFKHIAMQRHSLGWGQVLFFCWMHLEMMKCSIVNGRFFLLAAISMFTNAFYCSFLHSVTNHSDEKKSFKKMVLCWSTVLEVF